MYQEVPGAYHRGNTSANTLNLHETAVFAMKPRMFFEYGIQQMQYFLNGFCESFIEEWNYIDLAVQKVWMYQKAQSLGKWIWNSITIPIALYASIMTIAVFVWRVFFFTKEEPVIRLDMPFGEMMTKHDVKNDQGFYQEPVHEDFPGLLEIASLKHLPMAVFLTPVQWALTLEEAAIWPFWEAYVCWLGLMSMTYVMAFGAGMYVAASIPFTCLIMVMTKMRGSLRQKYHFIREASFLEDVLVHIFLMWLAICQERRVTYTVSPKKHLPATHHEAGGPLSEVRQAPPSQDHDILMVLPRYPR